MTAEIIGCDWKSLEVKLFENVFSSHTRYSFLKENNQHSCLFFPSIDTICAVQDDTELGNRHTRGSARTTNARGRSTRGLTLILATVVKKLLFKLAFLHFSSIYMMHVTTLRYLMNVQDQMKDTGQHFSRINY